MALTMVPATISLPGNSATTVSGTRTIPASFCPQWAGSTDINGGPKASYSSEVLPFPREKRNKWTKLKDPSLEQKYGSKETALDVSI